MNNINELFKLECLDHVALRVRDLDRSVSWYKQVLGLTVYQPKAWGAFPIFLLAGTTGIAMFPSDPELEDPNRHLKHVKIDHFAFRLSQADFQKAISRYDELGLNYNIQDHHYFHSIYTKDPDGHLVELTTLVVRPEEFYRF